jgi:hypothetical protein
MCLFLSGKIVAQDFDEKVLVPIYLKVDSNNRFDCCDTTVKSKYSVVYRYKTELAYDLEEEDTLGIQKIYADIYSNMLDDNYAEYFYKFYRKKMKNRPYLIVCHKVYKYLRYNNIDDEVFITAYIDIALFFDRK